MKAIGMTTVAAAGLICQALPTLVQGANPSFDCAKARTWSEVAVCKDAMLSNLDRDVATLYREAKAKQAVSINADRLRSAQKEWLREREQCKQRTHPADCLLSVYKQRVAELTFWAGRSLSKDQVGRGDSRELQPLPDFTGGVVWDGDAAGIHERCAHGDFACVLAVMGSTGASEQAIRFAQSVEGWAYDFKELGAIDVVGWTAAFAANIVQGEYLVNGTPGLISISDYFLTPSDRARSDVQRMLTRLPDGYLFSHRFVRKEPIPNGSRFIVEADYAQCNACRNEVVARVEIAYDVDSKAVFQSEKLLRVLPAEAAGAAQLTSNAETGPDQQQRHGLAAGEGAVAVDRIVVKDGSVLAGEIQTPTVQFESTIGRIEVTVSEMRNFSKGALHLTDGTVFKGSFGDGVLQIATSRGTLQVPMKDVAEIDRVGERK